MPVGRRVTIRDVAEAAGVSTAAVSYALRGIVVSEETQERVRGVAAELGYEVNPIARALVSGRTGMVGYLGPSLEDLWQQRLVAEAGRVLLERDRYALILDAGGDPDRQRMLARQLRDQHVDGLIVSPLDPSDPFWGELSRTLPVVALGDSLADATPAGEVLYDNRTGVRLALEHLHGLGHRHVAVLRPPGSPTNDRPAERIVAAEAERLGFEIRAASARYGLADATLVAEELLSSDDSTELDRRGPTAVFCFADAFAHGVYAAARAGGIRIPDDLSVIGYDDHPISSLLSPPLTTVDWSSTRLVQTALDMLIAAVDRDPSPRRRRVVVAPELRARGSAAPPPDR